jgi:16S rRNA (cytidine1402-2'-O)-methyltransferase
MSSTLYLVGTPIGNLEDITFRAIKTLQSVDLIAAEDTRHTGKLLKHFQITTPQISYHEHNEEERIPHLINKLTEGKSIAIVTDAGMPGISDPGYKLVQACIRANIKVVPIPGVTAVITALSASGLPTNHFSFDGFLPPKGQERQAKLELLTTETRTIVLYESPHRLITTLEDLEINLGGDRSIVITRELTKIHEEFWRGTINQGLTYYQHHKPQGEYTLVISGTTINLPIITDQALKLELTNLLQQGMSSSEASKYLANQTTFSKRYIYQLALEIKS